MTKAIALHSLYTLRQFIFDQLKKDKKAQMEVINLFEELLALVRTFKE